VELLAEGGLVDTPMPDVVRTWIRPHGKVAEFLEDYSRASGTHHSVLVFGDWTEAYRRVRPNVRYGCCLNRNEQGLSQMILIC